VAQRLRAITLPCDGKRVDAQPLDVGNPAVHLQTKADVSRRGLEPAREDASRSAWQKVALTSTALNRVA
jgi:hypothetical protein